MPHYITFTLNDLHLRLSVKHKTYIQIVQIVITSFSVLKLKNVIMFISCKTVLYITNYSNINEGRTVKIYLGLHSLLLLSCLSTGLCLESLFPPFPSAALAGRFNDYFSIHASTPAESPHSVKLMSCKNSISSPPQCSFLSIFC